MYRFKGKATYRCINLIGDTSYEVQNSKLQERKILHRK
jgi:hypothetical protein